MTPLSQQRRALAVAALVVAAASIFPVRDAAAQGATPPPLTLLAKDGRRMLQVTLVGNQEFVALDDLASLFQLAVREESGAVTVSYKGKTILLTPDQALASVAGKLVSLPAPPSRAGRRILVPAEFINRALSLIYDAPLDLRKPSRLVVVGDLRVPRVTIRFESSSTFARLTVDATPRANSVVSQENEKLTITFEADALDVSLPAMPSPPGGIIQGIRLADPVSLAVDLGPRFGSFRSSTQPSDSGSRLVLDALAASTDPATAAPATTTAAPPPPDLSALGQTAPVLRTIAIDPGHGGPDEGAAGLGGVKEKDLTLAVARRLRTLLEGRLGVRVLQTRDDDRNVAIDERAAMANNNKADLFISLHASSSPRNTVSGASIFYAAFDKSSDDVARASLGIDRLPTFAGGSRDIELVVWDLAQIRHADQSAEFAKILEQQFRDHVPLGTRAVSGAPLRVLESANMPAVIIEMGYMSNPDQVKALAGAEFQTAFVQAIVDAIVRFRDYLDGSRRSAGAPSPAGAGGAGGQP